MRWIPIIALVACLCQGCFVLEEIDKGKAIMDQHSPRKREEEAHKQNGSGAARNARKGDEEGVLGAVRGIPAAVQDWWKKAGEPAPPQRDPDDVVVRCQIGGSMHFTRKSDCSTRGGRLIDSG